MIRYPSISIHLSTIEMKEQLPTLCDDIKNDPSRILPAIAMVLHEVCMIVFLFYSNKKFNSLFTIANWKFYHHFIIIIIVFLKQWKQKWFVMFWIYFCCKIFNLFMFKAFLDDQFDESPQSIVVFFDVPLINVRLLNYTPLTPLKSLKSSYFGRLFCFLLNLEKAKIFHTIRKWFRPI